MAITYLTGEQLLEKLAARKCAQCGHVFRDDQPHLAIVRAAAGGFVFILECPKCRACDSFEPVAEMN